MPCFRCDVRQTDPERGASPWKRGVVRGEQVLVCPDCQALPGWTDEFDRCRTCGSTQLVKALGAVVCRSCGSEAAPVATAAAPAGSSEWSEALAADVTAALDRVLRRPSAAVPPGPGAT